MFTPHQLHIRQINICNIPDRSRARSRLVPPPLKQPSCLLCWFHPAEGAVSSLSRPSGILFCPRARAGWSKAPSASAVIIADHLLDVAELGLQVFTPALLHQVIWSLWEGGRGQPSQGSENTSRLLQQQRILGIQVSPSSENRGL